LKRLLSHLGHWEYKWLCLLVVVILILHFAIINIPNKPVFDEMHYVTDARSVIAGQETARTEHPSLGKLFVIGGMVIFGDNPFGWRFFSVILGVISIILVYLICRNLSLSRRTSLLAAGLLAFENFMFLYSGMAMLDVSCLTFSLAAFWFYLRGDYPVSGIMVALSALAKLGGALAIIAILLHWLITRRDKIWEFFGLMVFAPVFFVFLMPLTDYFPYHKWMNPLDRISLMLRASSSLTFANVSGTYPEKPWEWIFRWDLTPYYFHPNYLGVVSFTVEFLIVPVLIYMLYKAIRRSDAGVFGLCWFTATYLAWIPGVLLTNRVTYPYYIYPTIGAFCLGLGMGLNELIRLFEVRRTGKLRWVAISVVVLFLLAHLVFFALVSPLSYWWGTPIFSGLQS
jgi:predicted membrane-bound dolichyl-phosphate-mannose-protein mannosyltransferase